MKILITGGDGMLARALAAEFAGRGWTALPLARGELDVTDREAVLRRVFDEMPDVVVQGAAFTAVDAAEGDEARAFRVNASATAHVAEACKKAGALLVYPSTDYVFTGDSREPYTPRQPMDPLNAYGRTKAAGEWAARAAGRWMAVRTSWLYGPGGTHFVGAILRRAEAGDPLRVVDDQVGRPTFTLSLAAVIGDLVSMDAQGVFHATDGGSPVSWYGFAREVLRLRGISTEVEPVASTERAGQARRPAFSVLDCSSTEVCLGRALPDWRVSLRNYLTGSGSGLTPADQAAIS